MIFIACNSYQTARRRYPRAQAIARMPGGFMCFALRADYIRWRRNHDRSHDSSQTRPRGGAI